jgi:hypothetical protein
MIDGIMVDDSRHSVIGRKRQELGIELIARADVDRLNRVVEAHFLEKEGDLVAVRRRPVTEVNHRAIRNQRCQVRLPVQRAE